MAGPATFRKGSRYDGLVLRSLPISLGRDVASGQYLQEKQTLRASEQRQRKKKEEAERHVMTQRGRWDAAAQRTKHVEQKKRLKERQRWETI